MVFLNPAQGSFSTLCRILFLLCPSCAGFLSLSTQDSLSIFPPCHTWASFNPVRKIIFHFSTLSHMVFFNPAQGSFSTLCRILSYFVHPVQGSFLFPPRILFPSFHLVTHGLCLTLCRILFPCFHLVTVTQDCFLTLRRVLFPPCAGFLFYFVHPVQGSFFTLRGALFHLESIAQNSLSTLCRVALLTCFRVLR